MSKAKATQARSAHTSPKPQLRPNQQSPETEAKVSDANREVRDKARKDVLDSINLTYAQYVKVVLTLSAAAFAGSSAFLATTPTRSWLACAAIVCFGLSLTIIIVEMLLSMYSGHKYHDVLTDTPCDENPPPPKYQGGITFCIFASGVCFIVGLASICATILQPQNTMQNSSPKKLLTETYIPKAPKPQQGKKMPPAPPASSPKSTSSPPKP